MSGGFDDPAVARQRRRVGWWALVAKALLLAVLVGAWLLWEQGGWGDTGGPSALADPAGPLNGALASRAASAALGPGPAATAARAPTAAPTAVALATSQAASAGQADPEFAEICGVGRLSYGTSAPHLFEHAIAAAWPRLLEGMERSPAERSKAAALVLRHGLRMRAFPPTDLALSNEALPALVAMAQVSPDPALLRWALSLCSMPGAPASCKGLSIEAALIRAPDDLANWLLLAQFDSTQIPRALKGAAGATRFSSPPTLGPWVEAVVPADLSPHLRHLLLQDVQAIQAMASSADLAALGTNALSQACQSAGADRSTCLALAETLHQQAPDLLAWGHSIVIGKVHGWPRQRLDASRAEFIGLVDVQMRRFMTETAPGTWLSCSTIERQQREERELATYGELGALRRWQAAASAPAAALR